MKIIKSDTFPIILKTVEKIDDMVSSTYGRKGKGVLIDNGIEASVLDDGYTVLEELEFEDEAENAVLRFIRETTRKANRRAGDGTTTALLLLHQLLRNLAEERATNIAQFCNDDTVTIDILESAKKMAVEQLRHMAKPMSTMEELQDVAMVSFRNKQIADMVGELVFKTGVDGTITVEEHELLESTMEVKQGFFFNKGFVSPYFLNQPNGTSELKKPYVFVTEEAISRVANILPILEQAAQGVPVLFVGEIEGEALQSILLNKLKKNLAMCVVRPPAGNKTFFEDISLITGAKRFSFSKGDETATIEMCGRADKVIVSENDTTIIGVGGDQEELVTKINQLKTELTGGEDFAQHQLKKRIGALSNGIGILRIGGMTDGERRYTKAKADDAVHATQLALKGGVVKGGGVALAEVKTGLDFLDKTLAFPRTLLQENADVEVFDPVEVVISSVESAVSIAIVLFNSEGIIAYKNEK